MEAISNAGAAIGVLATDGVVLAAEKRILSKVITRVQVNGSHFRDTQITLAS